MREKQSACGTVFPPGLCLEQPRKSSDAFFALSLSINFLLPLSVRALDYSGYKTSAFHEWPEPQLPFL